MNLEQKLLYFVFDLLLPLTVGYGLSRQKRLKIPPVEKLMVANILTIAPILAVLSLWVIKLNLNLIWLPILGVAMQVLPGVIGFYRVKIKYENPLQQGSFILSAMLSNRGVVGAISVFVLFGEQGYAYARLVMLFAAVVLYCFCFPMARYFYENSLSSEHSRTTLASLLLSRNQVPVLGLAAGLLLNVSGVPRPAVFEDVFDVLLHVSMWMFLIPIGMSIEFGKMPHYWREVVELLGIKFIVTPLIITGLAYVLGLRGEVLATVAILAAAPTAINSVVTAKLHGLDVNLAMTAFVLTMTSYVLLVFPVILVIGAVM